MCAASPGGEQTTPSEAIAKENLCYLLTLGILTPGEEDPGLQALLQPRIVELFWPLFSWETFAQIIEVIR